LLEKRRLLERFSVRARAALKRIPKELKSEYRQFYFHSDVAQSRIVILLLAIAVALFGFSDYPFLGFSLTLYILEALRAGLIIYSLFMFLYLRQVKNFRSYDRSLLAYLLAFVAFSLLVNTTRLHSIAVHTLIAGISIFIFYLAIPTRFANQATLSLAYTAGEGALMLMVADMSLASEILTALFSLAFANIIAAVSSWQLHSYRWRIFHDYTERKKSERLIIIGQTAGMVGHDIRNPLQAIVSELYSAKQSLSKAPENECNKSILESLHIIQEQTDYINKIVADLQDYARPLQPNLTEVDICKLIPESAKTIHIPNNIQLSVICEQIPTLMLDPTYMRRILTNLITNAVQAMPNGGKLTVTTSRNDSYAAITVEDTGAGVPDDVKPRLFVPLFTTKAKGQGFGLPVVKRLVEAQGGTISFESQLGKGTKFIISLPIKGR